MNSRKSASGSQKTAVKQGSNSTESGPFNQITDREKTENQRVEAEEKGFIGEKEGVSQSILNKEQQEEEGLKSDAKEELEKFSKEELTPVLKKADKDAEKENEALETSYSTKEDEATDVVINAFLSL